MKEPEKVDVPTGRYAQWEWTTIETTGRLKWVLEGCGKADVNTGEPFFDHMIRSLILFGSMDLTLKASGDAIPGSHHLIEDVGNALGRSLDRMLGNRSDLARFGWCLCPMDGSLVRCCVDLDGRGSMHFSEQQDSTRALEREDLIEFFRALCRFGRITVHLDVLRSDNVHHVWEASFKALGLCLRQSVARTGFSQVASVKGVL